MSRSRPACTRLELHQGQAEKVTQPSQCLNIPSPAALHTQHAQPLLFRDVIISFPLLFCEVKEGSKSNSLYWATANMH
eukprot:1139354-Pelagomonas_calceolata.AAC.4